MITSLSDWLVFLRDMQSLICVPLGIAGLALMLFGWRLWKPCVGLSFALIGAALVTMIASLQQENPEISTTMGVAVVCGVCAYFFAKQALPLLGGMIGTCIVWQICVGFKLTGLPLYLVSALGMVGGSAMAFINRRILIIGVTGFLGAVLFMSGVTAFVMSIKSLYSTFQSMASGCMIVVPFVLLVPTVMSVFYQVSEVRRSHAEL